MTAPTPEPVGPQRLHPLSPLFEIGRSFFSLVVPGLVVLLLARSGDRFEVWYMALFVPAVATTLLRYITKRYQLTDEHLVIREGLLFRKVRHVPYGRIQNLDTVQNPLHRLLGVVEARIETAGGQEPEAVLRVVSVAALERLRAGLRARVPGLSVPPVPGAAVEPGTSPGGDPVVFRMGAKDVVLFGLLSQRGLALLAGLTYLVWEFDLWDRVTAELPVDPEELPAYFSLGTWVLAGLALLLLLQALTVVWAFLTLFDFHIARTDGGLRTTCGLWTRQTATLPLRRIQFLSVQQGLLQRLVGRVSLRVATAGGESGDDVQLSRRWLVPLMPRERLGEVLRAIQPEAELDDVEWRPVHPRAWRRMFVRRVLLLGLPTLLVVRQAGWWALPAVLLVLLFAAWSARARARRLAWAITPEAVFVRDGVLQRVHNVVRPARVQSVSLLQTPFDRRHRMATLRLDTAGGRGFGQSFAVPYLPLSTAGRLLRRVRRAAAETRFTW